MYRVAAYSNAGTRKKTNQDSCCAEVATTPYGDTAIIAVCDGVGGLSSGELASATAVRWLVDWFEGTYPNELATLRRNLNALFDRVQLDWETGLIALNSALRSHGRTTGTRLGTTFTAMLIIDGYYLIGHVGDTRVYHFFDGKMEQLTDDQTWVAREVARGNITPEQARSHPKKNVILQSVGTQNDLQPVFLRGEGIVDGDALMVCCDGFRNELFDDELLHAYGHLQGAQIPQLFRVNEELANMVMRRGEQDNVTAVVLTVDDHGTYDLEAARRLSINISAAREGEAPTGSIGLTPAPAPAPQPAQDPDNIPTSLLSEAELSKAGEADV